MKLLVVVLPVLLVVGLQREAPERPAGGVPRQDERAMFAVLRRDGVIAPFAALDGTRWSMPWPAGIQSMELPLNVESVPRRWWGGWEPGARWHAWLTHGSARELTLTAPVVYAVHCSRRIGVRTDYRPAEAVPPVPVEPYPKDGLAVAGGLRVDPIEIVDRSSEERASLAVSLLDDFDRAEEAAIRGIRAASGWRHPFGSEERRKLPVHLESWYRSRLDAATTVSYIEAVRSYPPGPDDEECGLETLFGGWVFQKTGGADTRTSIGARVTYCDRVGAMYVLPLGRVRVRDREYWIYQYSGWDDEWYAVVEVRATRARVVAEYYAGGRMRCG
ncbi:MAG TPA: hypothetical protein VLD67_01320 [Vicinamibacterales bacterium]|nr:hypothetical protein [Vicinamibacterales bacterium]